MTRALVSLLLLVPSPVPAEDRVEFGATYRGDLLRNSSGGIATGTR